MNHYLIFFHREQLNNAILIANNHLKCIHLIKIQFIKTVYSGFFFSASEQMPKMTILPRIRTCNFYIRAVVLCSVVLASISCNLAVLLRLNNNLFDSILIPFDNSQLNFTFQKVRKKNITKSVDVTSNSRSHPLNNVIAATVAIGDKWLFIVLAYTNKWKKKKIQIRWITRQCEMFNLKECLNQTQTENVEHKQRQFEFRIKCLYSLFKWRWPPDVGNICTTL